MTYFIGIDPGQKGGLAAMGPEREFVHCIEMPETSTQVIDFLSQFKEDGATALLEKSQPMPKQGVCSVYSYGHHCGMLEGFLLTLGLPYTLIKPQGWMKSMHVGADSDLDTKGKSVQIAQRLFPGVNLYPGKKTKPHDGMAEALLIAEYGRRLYLGQLKG